MKAVLFCYCVVQEPRELREEVGRGLYLFASHKDRPLFIDSEDATVHSLLQRYRILAMETTHGEMYNSTLNQNVDEGPFVVELYASESP